LLVVVCSLSSPKWSSAQEFRNMELNIFMAGSAYTKNTFESSYPQTIIPIQGKFRLDTALRGGVRFNINTTGHWGEEAFFSYEPNTAHFIRVSPSSQEQSYNIRVMNWGLNVMYYLNEEESRGTRPFLSIGLGGSTFQPKAEDKRIARDPLRGNLPGFETSNE